MPGGVPRLIRKFDRAVHLPIEGQVFTGCQGSHFQRRMRLKASLPVAFMLISLLTILGYHPFATSPTSVHPRGIICLPDGLHQHDAPGHAAQWPLRGGDSIALTGCLHE